MNWRNIDFNFQSYQKVGEGNIHKTYIVLTDNDKYFLKYTDKFIDRLKTEVNIYRRLGETNLDSMIPNLVDYKIEKSFGYIALQYIPNNFVNWKLPCSFQNFIDDFTPFIQEFHNMENINSKYNKIDKKSEFVDYFINNSLDTISNTKYELYREDILDIKESLSKKSFDLNITHGDLHMPNILCYPNGSIKSIIDYGRCMNRDSAYDIAKFEVRVIELFENFSPINRERILSNFRDKYERGSDEFYDRVNLYKLPYAVRTACKTEDREFETWKNIGRINGCSDQYVNDIIPQIKSETNI